MSDPGFPVVAMVGAGQLARMTHQAAIALGQSLRVLANDAAESAALVASDVRFGKYTELEALRELAVGACALTFDHEHVPTEHLRSLVAEGISVYPGPDALVFAQDKLAMRTRLGDLGFEMPRWEAVSSLVEVERFAAEVDWPIVCKTPRGGYDGKGVWLLESRDQAAEVVAPLFDQQSPLLVEERVPLTAELAVQVARSPYGQVAVWPVVETVQAGGVCVEVIAPAPSVSSERASAIQELAVRIAVELDVVGVLAIELFDLTGSTRRTPFPGVCINELAMRPHNSGHWTIEGSVTSQFEQHLRAVLDYPLGETSLTAPVTVMANVLAAVAPATTTSMDERLHHVFAADPGVKVHLYGKQARPGRKIGHVTVLGELDKAARSMPRHGADRADGEGATLAQAQLFRLRERAKLAAATLAGARTLETH